MKRNVFLVLAVAVLSHWTWIIFSHSILLGIVCLLLGYLIFIFATGNNLVSHRKLYTRVLTFLLILISGYSLLVSFDQDLLKSSEIQSIEVRQRQRYYVSELGSLYGNKLGIYYFDIFRPTLNKYINNMTTLVDFNILFLSNITDNKILTRFPLLFFPIMILGLYHCLMKLNKQLMLIVVAVVVLSGFLTTKNTLGPILIYPFILSSIGVGIWKIFNLRS